MPVGLSMPRYIALCVASMFTGLAGAQCVHMIYRPLDDLEDLVEQRLKEKREELKKK